MEDKEKIEELYERIWLLEKEKMELEERNSDAIQYIYNHSRMEPPFYEIRQFNNASNLNELLQILEGENNEN